MPTYEVNVSGEVDPGLKKGIKDVAKEAKDLSKAADKGKISLEDMTSDSKSNADDLAKIAQATAKLRAATKGLAQSEMMRKRVLGETAGLHAQLRDELKNTSRATGGLSKSTSSLSKSTTNLAKNLQNTAAIAASAGKSFDGIWDKGLEGSREFNQELKHIRTTTKGLVDSFKGLDTRALARYKSESLRGLAEVGAIPKAAGAVRRATSDLREHAQQVERTGDFYVRAARNAEKLGITLKRVSHAGKSTAFVADGSPNFEPLKPAFLFGGRRGRGSRGGGAAPPPLPPTGFAKATKEVDGFNQSIGRMRSSWASIITAFSTSYFVIKDVFRIFGDLTDGVIRFQNQIRQSTTTTHDFNRVMSRLRKVSRETGVSASTIGLTFQRLRIGLDALALPPERLLGWAEALTRGMAAFGIGATEATGAIRQLTQGLASGQLRGQELHSVLEQMPPVAPEIAGVLGVFTSDLRELGKQGKITQEVLMTALDRYVKRAGKAIKLLQLSPKQLFTVGAEGFADLFTKFMDDSGAMTIVVGTMKTINEYMASIVERARAGEPVFQRWAETIKGIGKVIYQVTLAVGSFLASAALVRTFNMVTRIIRDLKALGAISIFDNITKAITGLTGRGGLIGLGIAGLAGAGIFTLVDDFVNQFLEKINETIDPAVKEFKALMKERDSVLDNTRDLAEMMLALRRKGPEDLGVQELKRIKEIIAHVRTAREELARGLGDPNVPGFISAPGYQKILDEVTTLERAALENIEKTKREAAKIPTQFRNFLKMIEEGAFKANEEINKMASSFEKRVLGARVKTGQTGIFPYVLEESRKLQEQYPTGRKRQPTPEEELQKTFDYLFRGKVTKSFQKRELIKSKGKIGEKVQFPVEYFGHPRHAPAPKPQYRTVTRTRQVDVPGHIDYESIIKDKVDKSIPDYSILTKPDEKRAEPARLVRNYPYRPALHEFSHDQAAIEAITRREAIAGAARKMTEAHERIGMIKKERAEIEAKSKAELDALKRGEAMAQQIQARQRTEFSTAAPRGEADLINREKRFQRNQEHLDQVARNIDKNRKALTQDRSRLAGERIEQLGKLAGARKEQAAEVKRREENLARLKFDAAEAQRGISKIEEVRLKEQDPTLYKAQEDRLKKIIQLYKRVTAHEEAIKEANESFIAFMKATDRHSDLYKGAKPLGADRKSVHGDFSPHATPTPGGIGRSLSAEHYREAQLEGMRNYISYVESDLKSKYKVIDLPTGVKGGYFGQGLEDRKTGERISITKEQVAEGRMRGVMQMQQVLNYTAKTDQLVDEAHDNAKAMANTVGGSLVSAFRQVASAAEIFGDKWDNVIDTVIDQIGKLIVEFIALEAASAAASKAYGARKEGAPQGYEGLASTSTVNTAADAALGASAGGPKAAIAAAGIAIAGSVLAALLQKDKKRDREKKEFDDSLARERFRAALVAYVQRQRMIQLQLRTAVAVENAEQRVREAEARAEREKSLREAAEVQAYRSFAESRGGRINLEGVPPPIPPTVPTIPSRPPTTIPPIAVPPPQPPVLAEPAFSLIRDRFRADTADVEARRERRETPTPTPATPAPAEEQKQQPINVVVVNSEDAAEAYARSAKGRSLILNALEANSDEVRELLASTG